MIVLIMIVSFPPKNGNGKQATAIPLALDGGIR